MENMSFETSFKYKQIYERSNIKMQYKGKLFWVKIDLRKSWEKRLNIAIEMSFNTSEVSFHQ